MSYNELTRRYFDSPMNSGKLVGADVFRGAAGQREQGCWVQFDLRAQAGSLLTARFAAFGCPHTIAIASWVASQAAGKTLASALPECLPALRAVFALPVEKMGRLLIIEDAWRAAVTAALEYGH